jgi:putative ATPase
MRRRGKEERQPVSSLFEESPARDLGHASRPLAERMRPEKLADVVGQRHLLGPARPLRTMIERDKLKSMILWGPPGVGKTTIARLLAQESQADFVPFSAVMSGIKEIKAVMAEAEKNLRYGRRTVVFVDEIHRFNKAQQDAFLPYVERGDIVLIGATTENPSFEVNGALLSRAKVFTLRSLEVEELIELLRRATGVLEVQAQPEALEQIAHFVNGDARSALNLIEMAASVAGPGGITSDTLSAVLERKMLLYDKGGEEHYNLVSALHKSVRSSDVDAALYWLARMLESGEDRMYLARRLVRMAVEDIGLADPRAVEQAIACQQAVHFLGEPEGDQALAQITIYLAVAAKSDAGYQALKAAQAAARTRLAEPVPMQLRNAPTRLMKDLGYSKGYEHAHQREDGVVSMACLPPGLEGTVFYEPKNRGLEAKIRERLEERKSKRAAATSSPS